MHRLLPILLFATYALASTAQQAECNITLKGKVIDEHDGSLLEFAALYVEEAKKGAQSDSTGYFEISGLCPGEIHLIASHIQCERRRFTFDLRSDTSLILYMEHHSELLSTVTVKASKLDPLSAQSQLILNPVALDKSAGHGLAETIENAAGLNSLKSGPAVSKPVIHGLSGQRIQIVQAGLPQESQSWGQEHAPEVDPHAAKRIKIIRGSEGVKYGSNALGGVILVEPGDLPDDPHLHGSVSATGMSNSRMIYGAALLEGALPLATKWRYRIGANYKYAGDSRSPEYVLSNTGLREAKLTFQAGMKTGNWKFRTYYAWFDATYGILRGSHIGNLTDLQEAIGREQPFFTKDFTYRIENPKQEVAHHLLLLSARRKLGQSAYLTFEYGGQLNLRKEFDIRRGGRSDLPALDMTLWTHNSGIKFEHPLWLGHLKGEIGLNLKWQRNRNDADTGIEPLIPFYTDWSPAAYLYEKWIEEKWEAEAGIRYTYKILEVKEFDLQNNLQVRDHRFHEWALAAGWIWKHSRWLSYRTHLGYVDRAPAVNELYSEGLHHGAAAIEEGDPGLGPESSLKWTHTLSFDYNNTFWGELSVYGHFFDNFIQLIPTGATRLTIRGAFPVYRYVQQDARITGLDLSANWKITPKLTAGAQTSLIRGDNTETDEPLFGIPARQFRASLSFLPEIFLEEAEFNLDGLYTSEQKRFQEEIEFTPPPDAYFLLNAGFGSRIDLGANELKWRISAKNILNTEYRDYLNRLRYYADDTGFNLELRLKYSF